MSFALNPYSIQLLISHNQRVIDETLELIEHLQAQSPQNFFEITKRKILVEKLQRENREFQSENL